MRKIIQISACGTDNTCLTQSNKSVYVLCDDGTVWWMDDACHGWEKVPPIPQDDDLTQQSEGEQA